MSSESSTNDNFAKSYEKFKVDYEKIGADDSKKEEPKKPSGLKRKYNRIKDAFKKFWVVGKTGFELGAYAGGALGFILGAYESIRIKSFLPLPLAMIGTGFSFGCIFAISTVVRSHPGTNVKEILLETIYYDYQENTYKKKYIPISERYAIKAVDNKVEEVGLKNRI